MSTELVLRNTQRKLRLNLASFREITRHLLEQELELTDYELGVHFVSEQRMAEVNRQFLQHEGATDVITFNHSAVLTPDTSLHSPRPSPLPWREGQGEEKGGTARTATKNVTQFSARSNSSSLHGELFICPAIAREQAREFRTCWQEELVRYLVHGILHLRGFDDLDPARRRAMKREEARLLRRLARRFTLRKAGAIPRIRA